MHEGKSSKESHSSVPSLQYVLNKFIGILHSVNNIKSWVLADALQDNIFQGHRTRILSIP